MFNINSNMRPPLYDPNAVEPMRRELTSAGYSELKTVGEVEEMLSLNDDKTTFVVINSVCGCSAGSARPAAAMALQHSTIPDRYATVFAGMDRDAVEHLREKYLTDFPPSSPSMALFRNGEPVAFVPRHQIEGRDPEEISSDLTSLFDANCKNKGPAISPEAFGELEHVRMCGSKAPKFPDSNNN